MYNLAKWVVFANGSVQSQAKSYQRLKKWYLLNIQHNKVHIKGKVEQSRERSSALPYALVK